MRPYWFILGAAIAINPLQAEIYKWTDSSGNIHFSDSPHPGAEQLKLPKIQTYSAPVVPASDKTPDLQAEPEITGYEKINILQPQDQLTIRNTQGYVSIVTELDPMLKKGDKLQVIFDGSPVGKPQESSVIALRDINRGSHTIAIQALDKEGKVLITSDTITIFMMPPRVGMGKGAP